MVKFNLNNFLLFEKEMLDETTAYHGSPYNFDEFDTKFMGKGQGAQVHGWGLYFSLNPDTGYRNGSEFGDSSSFKTITYNGKVFEKGSQAYAILYAIQKRGKEETLKIIKRLMTKADTDEYKSLLSEFQGIVDKIKPKKIAEISLHSGQNYTVELPDVESMLNEDASMSHQPKNVQKAFKDIYKENNFQPKLQGFEPVNSRSSGRDWYINLMNNFDKKNGVNSYNEKMRGDKFASLALLDHGVPGIYYTGGWDGKCCVIFSGKDVKIVSKDFDAEKNQLDAIFDIETIDPDDIKGANLSQEIQSEIAKKRPDLFQWISNPTPKTCMEYIKQNPEQNFLNMDKSLQFDKLCKYAIQLNYRNFEYVEQQTSELLVMAAKINTRALAYVHWYNKIQLTIDDLWEITKSQDLDYFYGILLGAYSTNAEFPNGKQDFIKKLLNNESLRNGLVEKLYSEDDLILLINFINIYEFIDEYPKDFLNKINQFILLKLPHINFRADLSNLYELCIKLFKYMNNKQQLQLLKFLPRVAKKVAIPENVLKKFIQMNPYNIRYIRTPGQDLIDFAIKSNPEVKDFIAKQDDF